MMVLLAPVSRRSVAGTPFTLASTRINECTERKGRRTGCAFPKLGGARSARAATAAARERKRRRNVRFKTPTSCNPLLLLLLPWATLRKLRERIYPAAPCKLIENSSCRAKESCCRSDSRDSFGDGSTLVSAGRSTDAKGTIRFHAPACRRPKWLRLRKNRSRVGAEEQ